MLVKQPMFTVQELNVMPWVIVRYGRFAELIDENMRKLMEINDV